MIAEYGADPSNAKGVIMFTNTQQVLRSAGVAGLIAVAAAAASGAASAQPIPRSWEASPDIHRVIAEDDKYVVIESVWKPGQRDQIHSSPARATYYLTDCNLRIHLPDGKRADFFSPALIARLSTALESYSVENIGQSDCRSVTFVPK